MNTTLVNKLGTILVTGGTGFVGRHIVANLLKKGYSVRLLLRESTNKIYPRDKEIEVAQGNLLDVASLKKALTEVSCVIHTAAVKKGKKRMWDVNVQGTANLINCSLEAGVKKYIQISSISAIGPPQHSLIVNETTPWKGELEIPTYAATKYKAELEVNKGIEKGLYALFLNPGLIIGTTHNWNDGNGKFFKLFSKGIPFYFKGQMGFVGVKDVARACQFLLEQDIPNGEKYLLVSENWDFFRFHATAAKYFKVKPPKWPIPISCLIIYGWIAEKWAELLGGEPKMTVELAKKGRENYHFDGSKITKSGFSYTSLNQTVKDTVESFLYDKRNSGQE